MKKTSLTLAFYVASKLRTILIFKLLKFLYRFSPRNKLLTIFDPNSIRKHIRYHGTEKLAKIEGNFWQLTVDLNDHIGYWSYIRNRPFEESVHQVATKMKLGEGDVILDIGANIGTATIPVCSELNCELIAIEASRFNGKLLIQNILANNIKSHCNLIALYDQVDGYIDLHLRNGNRGANSVHRDWNPSKSNAIIECVPATTLDKLSSKNDVFERVALIKIDVEGAELSVLKGGRSFLSKCSAPIIMEYRTDLCGKQCHNTEEILDIFGDEYEISAINQAGKILPFDPAQTYENILVTKCKPS